MRIRALFVALAVFASGCTGSEDDPGKGDTHATDTDDTDPADTDDTDPAPVDRDGDGSFADVDCDDTDPAAHPGAAEAWDDVDNDCDGVVDADGAWAGDIAVVASAVYEGRRYNFSLTCPYVGSRALGQLAFAITCTPDPTDADAQRLLGATLTITPEDPEVSGDRWEDDVVFTSSNGWDSDGDGTIAWSGYAGAELEVGMSGVSLQVTGRGGIARR